MIIPENEFLPLDVVDHAAIHEVVRGLHRRATALTGPVAHELRSDASRILSDADHHTLALRSFVPHVTGEI